MGTVYQQGYAFENRIVRKLNALGGLAYRTAGSHSPIDITYWFEDVMESECYVIQCKHSKKKDIDFKQLMCDDNTIALTNLKTPKTTVKVLLIKQPRSRKVIQLYWNNASNKWILTNRLDLD